VLDRRRFLAKAAAAGLVLGGSGLGFTELPERGLRQIELPPAPRSLPPRQHAWNAALDHDADGNPVAPRFQRLLFFDLDRPPTLADVRRLEAALRELEQRYPWSAAGLLLTAGWGPRYFTRTLRIRSPIERPRALSAFELPSLDDYDLCLHIACDRESRLAMVERHLIGGVGNTLHWRETRTGFVGARLPAAHQHVDGIPNGAPVHAGAPLYMGFKSGYRRNQASEDAVTIPEGPLANGTTMHVSRMRLRLDDWYELLDERDRVARMFAPQVSPAQVDRFTTDAPSHPGLLGDAARRFGVVGHAQASARARRNGRPRILRRDFDSADGGEAGLHFVSLQRTIGDFVATRTAMNAAHSSYINPAITDTVNNGINDFIFVTHRGNYLVPPRAQRAFPLLPGREAALA